MPRPLGRGSLQEVVNHLHNLTVRASPVRRSSSTVSLVNPWIDHGGTPSRPRETPLSAVLSLRGFVVEVLPNDVNLRRWDTMLVEDVERATAFVDETA
jgi:hypothetical protein